MAKAIMSGLAVGLAATGLGAPVAIALGAAAAGLSAITEKAMAPDAPKERAVQLGDKGTEIDKSQVQEQSKIGKLKVGEEDKKKKRKKGKAAFKIELDKKKAEGGSAPDTGVQVKAPKDTGVQL